MNVYRSIGYAVGTPEALALAARLSAWHDAMVAHQRPADTARITRCDADCPHAEAKSLWHEAVSILGDGANQLGFLRRHGVPARHLRQYDRDVPTMHTRRPHKSVRQQV
jgi:hypothetical protein